MAGEPDWRAYRDGSDGTTLTFSGVQGLGNLSGAHRARDGHDIVGGFAAMMHQEDNRSGVGGKTRLEVSADRGRRLAGGGSGDNKLEAPGYQVLSGFGHCGNQCTDGTVAGDQIANGCAGEGSGFD